MVIAMEKIDCYSVCPEYETEHFRLRLIKHEDAEELLCCYSDRAAVARMNSDNCNDDFYYDTLDKMRSAIDFWVFSYNNRFFVRLSLIAKDSGKAIGTIEMFGGSLGVWRLDLASAYEKAEYITELTQLAVKHFKEDFNAGLICVKAAHTPMRAELFTACGFKPTDDSRVKEGYYVY